MSFLSGPLRAAGSATKLGLSPYEPLYVDLHLYVCGYMTEIANLNSIFDNKLVH